MTEEAADLERVFGHLDPVEPWNAADADRLLSPSQGRAASRVALCPASPSSLAMASNIFPAVTKS